SSIGFTQDEINAYGGVVGSAELSTFGHTAVGFGNGFAAFTNGGRSTDRPEDESLQTFGDTFSWAKGTHFIKIGGDVVRNSADDGFTANRGSPRGALTYSGPGATGLADFLMGLPATSVSYILNPRPPMQTHNWEHGYFVQDNWQVNSKLTLNLGLRYELVTPFVEDNDLMVNFDPNYVDPTTGQKGIFVVPSTKTLKYLDTRLISYGVETVAQSHLGIGPGLVRLDKTDFAPRVGFAWHIGGKSVLRGGWGIYYPTSAAQAQRDALASNGFNQSVTIRSVAGSPLEGWPGYNGSTGPLSGGAVHGFGNTPSPNLIDFNMKQPRIQQYNVTFEHDLGWNTALRLSYLGTAMHGLIAGADMNEIPASNNPFGTSTGDGVTACDPVNNGDCALSAADSARLPFPNLGENLIKFFNYGHGLSNAFQAQAEHRFSKGLMFSASYTYLDQKSTALDTDNSSLGGLGYDIFNPGADYGTDGFISKHRFVAYGIYDLPFGRGRQFGSHMNRWVDWAVGGWQTTFNMFIKSGTGFTPFWICDDCDPIFPGNIGSGAIDAVGDFNGPSLRPTVVSSTSLYVKQGDQYFNPAAFGLPPIGADLFSNPAVATRNVLWGPGTWGVNLGVHKNFRFGEKVTAQLGADVDNLFNHPLLSPDGNYGGGGGPFALLGDFNVRVDPNTLQLLPIASSDVNLNPTFGRLVNSFSQEGIDSRRSVRLRLRITF
ncbi:MAG: TonB-dependent receptor, partial [Acidobacteriaceae bacterium]|nr:TonB-dependent receptor [Acidobacteriaceae bacterium]